jgi:phosphatidylserine/phosphatidylglycerophosphate/cardiolipin synthase-like enzyme
VNAVAIDLAALGDVGPLWHDWLDDAARRYRVDVTALDEQLPNWRPLLERFAEERAPVYFRRDAEVSAALRRLHAAGVRVDVVESGDGARERVLSALGEGAVVVDTRVELVGLN